MLLVSLDTVVVAVLIVAVALYVVLQAVSGVDVIRLRDAKRIANATRPNGDPTRRPRGSPADQGAIDVDAIIESGKYESSRRDSTHAL